MGMWHDHGRQARLSTASPSSLRQIFAVGQSRGWAAICGSVLEHLMVATFVFVVKLSCEVAQPSQRRPHARLDCSAQHWLVPVVATGRAHHSWPAGDRPLAGLALQQAGISSSISWSEPPPLSEICPTQLCGYNAAVRLIGRPVVLFCFNRQARKSRVIAGLLLLARLQPSSGLRHVLRPVDRTVTRTLRNMN